MRYFTLDRNGGLTQQKLHNYIISWAVVATRAEQTIERLHENSFKQRNTPKKHVSINSSTPSDCQAVSLGSCRADMLTTEYFLRLFNRCRKDYIRPKCFSNHGGSINFLMISSRLKCRSWVSHCEISAVALLLHKSENFPSVLSETMMSTQHNHVRLKIEHRYGWALLQLFKACCNQHTLYCMTLRGVEPVGGAVSFLIERLKLVEGHRSVMKRLAEEGFIYLPVSQGVVLRDT